MRFRLGPDLSITIGARVKSAGKGLTKPVELSAVRQQTGDEVSAYERLIGDALQGDPLLFARADAVESLWAIVDPLVAASTPVVEYEPGSWGPAEANRLAADIGGWENAGQRRSFTASPL